MGTPEAGLRRLWAQLEKGAQFSKCSPTPVKGTEVTDYLPREGPGRGTHHADEPKAGPRRTEAPHTSGPKSGQMHVAQVTPRARVTWV